MKENPDNRKEKRFGVSREWEGEICLSGKAGNVCGGGIAITRWAYRK